MFCSPLAVASFGPIVDLLQSAGLARRTAGGYRVLDLTAFVAANQRDLRWDQIPGNATFPVAKAVLVATTRPADSNSAALFAAVLNQVTGGDLAAVTKVFADQGAVDTTTEEPFESWLRRGKDFAPLVLVYEAQFLDRGTGADHVLLYPCRPSSASTPWCRSPRPAPHWRDCSPRTRSCSGSPPRTGSAPPAAPGAVALGATDTIPSPAEPTLHALLIALEERLT